MITQPCLTVHTVTGQLLNSGGLRRHLTITPNDPCFNAFDVKGLDRLGCLELVNDVVAVLGAAGMQGAELSDALVEYFDVGLGRPLLDEGDYLEVDEAGEQLC